MVLAGGIEVHVFLGYSDHKVILKDRAYIFEFKRDASAVVVLNQIVIRHYADKYLSSHKNITLIGINIDSKSRNIADWTTDTVE